MTLRHPVFSLALVFSVFRLVPALHAVPGSLPSTASSNLTTVFANGGAVSTAQATSGGVSTLTVTSTAPTTVLNWGNFWDNTTAGGLSDANTAIVFTLPGATASILNEIAGVGTTAATTIAGPLSSNGKVFLLNQNGIVVSGTSTINTAGFYLSTLQENVSYFEQNGTLQVFSSTPPVASTSGAINVNQSLSTIGGSGDVRLAGNGVLVSGTISGNVYIVDVGAATPSLVGVTGTIASTTVGGTTVGGNLTTSGTNAQVRLATLSVGGNLSIASGGGQVELAQSGTTTVTGSTVVNTVGATNGNVSSHHTIISAGLAITTGTGTGTNNGTVSLGDIQPPHDHRRNLFGRRLQRCDPYPGDIDDCRNLQRHSDRRKHHHPKFWFDLGHPCHGYHDRYVRKRPSSGFECQNYLQRLGRGEYRLFEFDRKHRDHDDRQYFLGHQHHDAGVESDDHDRNNFADGHDFFERRGFARNG
jgi:filamentous hemagglutinin family protein